MAALHVKAQMETGSGSLSSLARLRMYLAQQCRRKLLPVPPQPSITMRSGGGGGVASASASRVDLACRTKSSYAKRCSTFKSTMSNAV